MKKKIYADIITFMIIFLNGSFAVTNDIISSFATIGLSLLVLLFLIAHTKKINGRILIQCAVLAIITLASIPINGEGVYHPLTYVFSLMLGFFYYSSISYDDFQSSFRNVMYFLSLVSVVSLLICIIFPPIASVLTVTNKAGYPYTFWGIFVKHPYSIRNCGMFWEPGAFQTFIGLALLFEMISKDANRKRMTVLIITLFSTFSTTGFISLIIIAIIALFTNKVENGKVRKLIITSVFLIPVFLFVSKLFFADISENVFGKINKFLDGGQYIEGNQGSSSASIRYYAIIKPIEVFINHPFWGIGYEGLRASLYTYTRGMNTCTFVNWFAMYGAIYGVIMIRGIINIAKKLSDTIIVFSLILLFFFVSTISENYVNVPIFFAIVFYGLERQTETINNLDNRNKDGVYENTVVN